MANIQSIIKDGIALGRMVKQYQGEIQRSTFIWQKRTPYSLYNRLFNDLTLQSYSQAPTGGSILKQNPQQAGESRLEYSNRMREILKEVGFYKGSNGGIEKWIPEQNGFVSIEAGFVGAFIKDTVESRFNYDFFDVLWEIVFRRLMSTWDFGDGNRMKYFEGAGYKWIKIPIGELAKRLREPEMTEGQRRNKYQQIKNAFEYWSQIRVKWDETPEILKKVSPSTYAYLGPFITNAGYSEQTHTFTISVNELWFIGTYAFKLPGGKQIKGYFVRPQLSNGEKGVVNQMISFLSSIPNAKGKFQTHKVKRMMMPLKELFPFTGKKNSEWEHDQIYLVADILNQISGLTTRPCIIENEAGQPRFSGKVDGQTRLEILWDLGKGKK